jgi:activator of HSP90 ATPase
MKLNQFQNLKVKLAIYIECELKLVQVSIYKSLTCNVVQIKSIIGSSISMLRSHFNKICFFFLKIDFEREKEDGLLKGNSR